jgi:hypothetical protein
MNPMMTIEKQVRIPANRHIHMDVDFTLPETWTPGEVISLLISPIPQTASTVEEAAARQRLMENLPSSLKDDARVKFSAARQKLRELCKDSKLTSDDFLEQRCKEDRLEKSAEDVSPADMPFLRFRGSSEGLETWDEYVERHRAGNANSQQRTERYRVAIKNCRGLAKRMGCRLTSDDFLEQRRKDKELEDRLDALHEEERRQSREQRQGRE